MANQRIQTGQRIQTDQRVQADRRVEAGQEGERRRDGFRTDIQALRALAVTLVVVNHLWPNQLTGGYIGVDVFFVISGFIISSQLIREINRTGRIQLAQFYGRRVRRLLPAAFLVLIFVVIATYALLPRSLWTNYAEQVMASATYWQNWLLAAKFATHAPTQAQYTAVIHYWSLSVEEQFYLLWPLLLLLLFSIRARWARYAGMTIVGFLSLGYSVYLTEAAKSPAYFVLPVRVWEFAIGALVALAGPRFIMPRIAANLTSLLGFAMIMAAALLFTLQSPFPGAIALIPAVGTALIIAAGTDPRRQWHTTLSSSAPVQTLGDISYSLYLWHWPLVILAPFALPGLVTNGLLDLPLAVGILVVSLLLAYLSKRLIEDPVRRWPRLTGSTRLTFTGMVAGMIVVCLVAAGVLLT
jgi:peptidoglycan/LPS O-acetylase OafA/YrhL